MKGKTVVITGATSGIGKETAIGLARLGASIVMTTRDMARGEQAREDIMSAGGGGEVELVKCDLAEFASIRKCCKQITSEHDRIDVLINNAGIWMAKRKESKDGIELTFAVNFLAPFLMTKLLLPTIEKSRPARIITLSSGLHTGAINFDDIEGKRKFSGWKAYRQSKLAVILFTRLLAKKLKGKGVTVNCIAPGFIATGLGREANAFMRFFFKAFGGKPEKGAQVSILAASSPKYAKISGEYISSKGVERASEESHDMEMARRLWEVAEGYVGK